MDFIDISPPVDSGTAVFPGDTPLSVEWIARMEKGGSCNVSTLRGTPHLGAHADGPLHFDPEGLSIGEVDLTPYLGKCRVVDCTGARVVDEAVLAGENLLGAERILFRTGTYPDPATWTDDFAWISESLVRRLGRMGVLLVGIDTPSVDPADSKDLPTHHALQEMGMRNLEGLDLSLAEPGTYELIALPLRLVGVDSSPVRAVLRRTEEG